MEGVLYLDIQDLFDIQIISQLIIQGKKIYSIGDENRKNNLFLQIDKLSDIPKKKQYILCLDKIHFIDRNQLYEQLGELPISVWFTDGMFSKVRHYKPCGLTENVKINNSTSKEIENLRSFLEKTKRYLKLTDLNYICSVFSEEEEDDKGQIKMLISFDIPCKIYHIPLLTNDVKNGSVDPCERFAYRLLDFVSWIELRIPEYFSTHNLLIVAKSNQMINLLDKENIANNILLHYNRPYKKDYKEQIAEYCILNHSNTRVDDFIQSAVKSISNVSGKKINFIRVIDDIEKLNFIDIMFNSLIGFYVPIFGNQTSLYNNNNGKRVQIDYCMAEDKDNYYRLIAEHIISKKRRIDEISVGRRMKSITLDKGQKMVYYSTGSGEPILIVNAFGAYVEAWDRLIYELSNNYYVIIWEIRGVMEGSKELFERGEFGISSQVRDIERIVSYEKLDKFHILAWCSGIKSAAIYASKHQNKVKSLIFMAGDYAPYHGIESNNIKFRDNISLIKEIVDGKPRLLRIYMQLIFGGLFRTPSVDLSDDIESVFFEILPTIYRDKLLALFQSENQTVNFLRICMEYYKYDVSDILSTLTQAVTIISAEYDQVASANQSLWAHDIIEHSIYHCIPSSTHLLMLERTEDVMRCIDEHMEKQRPTGFMAYS